MERLRRMLVVGGEGPERSYWPACCGKVTIGLVLDVMEANHGGMGGGRSGHK